MIMLAGWMKHWRGRVHVINRKNPRLKARQGCLSTGFGLRNSVGRLGGGFGPLFVFGDKSFGEEGYGRE
jgi:hypothetical protein